MNGFFIAGLAFAAIGVLALLASAVVKFKEDRIVAWGVSGLAVFIALTLTVIASAWTVPQRNIGIVTSANKATGETTGAGWHWTAPWEKIEDWDAGRQTFDHLDENTCVQVRITGMDTACVEVLIEWEAKAEKAPEQWASYRKNFNFFKDRRVNPNLTDALNASFRSHDPVKTVDAKSAAIIPVDMNEFKKPTMDEINSRIGADVNVLSITFGFIRYNEGTQKTIDAYRAKVMEARNLEQDEKNAETRKRITDKSAGRDPRAWCLEIAEKHGKEPGFCLGGGNPTQITGGR